MSKDDALDDALLELYLDACYDLDCLIGILTERGWTNAELAVYYKEHREGREP